MAEDFRAALDTLIRERGEDYASLSRMLGRNPAYIQQFLKRGIPRKLDEEDRRTLARYFGVEEARLGGPARPRVAPAEASPRRAAAEYLAVRRLDARASAGPGATDAQDNSYDRIRFDANWLREVAGGGTAGLAAIRVTGDSMAPTLADGDEILVNSLDGAERLRDGIYVLRVEEGLLVKRIAINPAGGRITIRSDNPAYPAWPDCDPAGIEIIGRVVWAGRRIG